MTIGHFLRGVRKNKVLVAICLFLTCFVGALNLAFGEKNYTSTSGTYYSVTSGTTTIELSQGTTLVSDQLKSFAFLARSDLVLSHVKNKLRLPQDTSRLSDQIVISIPTGTLVMLITATDPDPNVAAALANEVALRLNEIVPSVTGSLDGTPTSIRGTLVSPARVSGTPSSPSTSLTLMVSVLSGLLLSLAAIAFRNLRERRQEASSSPGGLTGKHPALQEKGSGPRRAIIRRAARQAPFLKG